jgi:hypothetical protein
MAHLAEGATAATTPSSFHDENHPAPDSSHASPAPDPRSSAPKPRSCAVCRTRKVRCDKKSPCSNCRRANIPCVLPTVDKLPRWARQLERRNNHGGPSLPPTEQAAGKVLDRLRNLEDLVRDLRGQLEQAHAASSNEPSAVNSPGSASTHRDAEVQAFNSDARDTDGIRKQLGHMVIQDADQSRYVSSAFWSRVDDEVGPQWQTIKRF